MRRAHFLSSVNRVNACMSDCYCWRARGVPWTRCTPARSIPNLKVSATSLDDGNGRGRGFQSPLPYARVQRYRAPHFLSQSRQPIPARLFRRLSLCVSPVGQDDFRQRPSGVVEIQQQYVRASQVVITRGPEIFRAGVVVPNPRDSASERPLCVGDVHVPVDRLEAGSVEYLRARGRRPGGVKKNGSGDYDVTHPLSPRTAPISRTPTRA